MTISSTNQTVSASAPVGTVVGVLTAKQGSTIIPCVFYLFNNQNGYFAISGNNLVTAKSGMTVGAYPVQVVATPVTLSDATALTIQVTAPPLSNGTYVITTVGSNAIDGGFGAISGHTPFVQLAPTNKGMGQQWVWNGSKLQNVAVPPGGVSGGASGPFLADAGDGTATENATGDIFTLIKVTGFNILDTRTQNYLGIAGNKLNFGIQKSVWNFTAP